jgi:uncharacterized protein
MSSVLVPVVAASLVGSLHCAGMCGGLVAFATGDGDGSAPRRLGALAAYNGMRGLGYVTLGALAGTLGGALDDVGLRIGLGRAAGVVAGVVMLAWGALRLLEAGGIGTVKLGVPASMQAGLARVVRAARSRPPVLRSAAIGGCTAALPCGWLHAFTVVAAGTGGAASGAAVMAAFWLGTVPALVGLGLGVQSLTSHLRSHAQLVGALALVCVGLASVLGHLHAPLLAGGANDHCTVGPHAGLLPDGPKSP